MARFSDEIVEQAWKRSGGTCECENENHGHTGRCGKTLLRAFRSDRFSYFGWEVHSKSGQYMDSLDDCEILCIDPCYIAFLEKK
jgi:hypothetical protein